MHTATLPIRIPARTKRWPRAARLVFAACLGILAEAQQPSAPHYASPPIWPGESGLASQPADRLVFVSPERDAIIVRAPPEWARAKGKPAVVRYELHNRLRPSLLAQMSASRGGYVYDYTIGNGRDARDVIQTWSLTIPAAGDQPGELEISGSGHWYGGHSFAPIMRQVELPDQPLGRVAVWVQDETDRMISPGGSHAGFRIESSCRPGFTTALFGSGTIPGIDQEFPDEVFAQLDFYNDPTWKDVPELTFGPMFCGETPQRVIAQNMISGIKRSIDAGRVRSTSEFAREALAKLNAPITNDGPVATAMASRPSGEFEEEVSKALQLSLSFQIAAR